MIRRAPRALARPTGRAARSTRAATPRRRAYYVGWDVGGWNCDRNPRSRDALVVLDAEGRRLGAAGGWRGNLRACINGADDAADFVARLFGLCEAELPISDCAVVLAIDAPLGFPHHFTRLVTARDAVAAVGRSTDNPYLLRMTERFLAGRLSGRVPLSAVKDMIGSQATKAIHVQGRFAPTLAAPGVWCSGRNLRVIETYPAVCHRSTAIKRWRGQRPPRLHDDLWDAWTCALVALLFDRRPGLLQAPPPQVPASEGWIWVPRDALQP